MGILNVTPDSFSDGGKFYQALPAIEHALRMEAQGADIIDVGGESTRPGSANTPCQEELARVLPVLQGLRGRLKIPISIDTRKSEVAERAIAAGAEILNDVTGLRADPRLAQIAQDSGVPMVLMHMRGDEPRTMQARPFARHVVPAVKSGLRASIARARAAGVPKSRIILDPGIGFGKSYRQNCELIARLSEIAELGYPLLIGTSRKGFIGKLLGGAGAEQRAWGTAATVTASILAGAHIVRVHEVAEMVQVARVADALRDA